MKENKLKVSFFIQEKRTNKKGLVPIIRRIHKINTNYNQVIRLMHLYTAKKSVLALLQELIRLTKEISTLQEQAVTLTNMYRKNSYKKTDR